MNKKLLKTITGIAVAGAALGAAFAYVKKCKEVNDLGEEDFDDLWDDEEEKNPEVNSCTPCRSYTTIPSDTPVPEDEEEELVRTLVREQALPEDFETLFKYQGEHKMWEAEIARADDFERNSDSFFVNWVDSIKLEEKLKFWIKGNITSQQSWYIVWCLMKYTFHMVRDNQDKAAFAARMNLMFPDAEKKCVVESFRKQETQMNHNRPFDKWLKDSDPDYHTAQSLYEKLKKTEEYNRSI